MVSCASSGLTATLEFLGDPPLPTPEGASGGAAAVTTAGGRVRGRLEQRGGGGAYAGVGTFEGSWRDRITATCPSLVRKRT